MHVLLLFRTKLQVKENLQTVLTHGGAECGQTYFLFLLVEACGDFIVLPLLLEDSQLLTRSPLTFIGEGIGKCDVNVSMRGALPVVAFSSVVVISHLNCRSFTDLSSWREFV